MNFRPNSIVSASVRALLRGTALSALAVCASTALAQVPSASDSGVPSDSDASSGSANEPGLPEVVVTAEKRSQNLINVPASISVLTGTALGDQQITTTDDLTRAVPGLSFAAGSTSAASAGVGSEGLVIRGIGSSAGLSATVGVYVDDVNVTQLSQAGNFSPMIFDLDRVEVLRGPQGTVFGASAEGGTVRYITNQPNLDDFSGLASASVSHTEHGSFNTDDSLVLNIPVVGNVFAVRVGGEFTDNSGWINRYANEPGTILTPNNVLLQSGTNLEHDYAVRVVGKYQPDDSLTITPSVDFQQQHQDDTPVFYLGAGLYNESNVVAEPATDSGAVSSITIDKHFGLGDLTSISSYFSRDFGRKLDGTYFDPYYVTHFILDYNPLTEAEAPIANDTLAVLPTTVHVTDKTTSFTQEVRLSSPSSTGADQRLSWLIGAVFSNTVDHWRDHETAPGWNALFQSIYGYSPNNPVLSPVADPTDPTAWQDDFVLHTQRYGYRQVGGFGQVEYKVFPKLTASAGLRYQVTQLTYSYNGQGFYNIGIPNVNDDHVTDSATTPKLSLTYAFTSTAKLYATAAKGYRDGGYNSPNPAGICGSFETSAYRRSFRPDELWSYETGFKGLLADRHLSINADGYELRWSQTQQPITIPVCGWSYTTNVGSATAYGSEIELLYRVPSLEGLTLGANGGTEHAYVTSAGANSPTQVGENLLYAPRWTATATAVYTRAIGSGLSLSMGVDNYWQGKSYGDFVTTATDYINKPYSVLNARVSVLTEHGFEAGLFVKNLLDNTTIIRSPSLAFVTEAYTVPPRMIGIQIKQQF